MRMNFSKFVIICWVVALCSGVQSLKNRFHKKRFTHRTLKVPSYDKSTAPPAEWFEQKLDHFNEHVTSTWKQKYYTRTTFHKTGGPAFLYIDGEGESDPGWLSSAAWVEYAEEFHAICFQLEHRFYGKSHPTKDLSVGNLSYLSSKQALADVANFIKGMTKKYNLPSGTKWVAFGGSYAGALAAWVRLKYPDVVHAAVSSSGPLQAVVDFKEFYGSVATSLATAGESCVNAIQDANKEMSSMLSSSAGLETLRSRFRLCSKIDPANKNDQSNLCCTLADSIADMVQGNNDDSPSWSTSTTNIDNMCKIMKDASAGSALNRYSELNKMLLNQSGSDCLDTDYDDWITYVHDVSWSANTDGDRQWLYQTCTEFGYFATSNQQPHVFGDKFPLDFLIQQCPKAFGSRFNATSVNAGVQNTNKMYGGRSIQVSNVVFVHGSIDPWHVAGVTSSTSSSAPVIFIQGTSHCADMYATSSDDLPQLTEARKKIRSYLKQWL